MFITRVILIVVCLSVRPCERCDLENYKSSTNLKNQKYESIEDRNLGFQN